MLGGRIQKADLLDATPWPWPISAAEPGLVACPIPASAPGGLWAAQEMYRLAYERAMASARPTRYALARHGSTN